MSVVAVQTPLKFDLPMRPHTPLARMVHFETFNNKYSGQACHIVGRGKTDFDYDDLSQIDEPIFFINDAISISTKARSETFFFAHDSQLLGWLNGSINSTAVLSLDSKLVRSFPGIRLRHAGPLTFYRWRLAQKETLLKMSRDEIAACGQLYHHSGTMHSLLHFIWYCGFARVTFIGCDGIAPGQIPGAHLGGYDPRLFNRSNSAPAPWQYATIRKAQYLLSELFGFETRYLGTPKFG